MKKSLALCACLTALAAGAFTNVITKADGTVKVRRGELGKSDYVVTDVDFGDKLKQLNEAIEYIAGSNVFMTVTNNTLSIYARTTNDAPEVVWTETLNLSKASAELEVKVNTAIRASESRVNAVINENLIVDKAWGRYAPDGSANPDTNNVVFINSPTTIFAGGYEWQSVWLGDQCISVLTQSKSATVASGEGSSFRIGPSSTNWFGYVDTKSSLEPCRTDGIRTYPIAGTVEMDYDYDGSTYPIVYWTTDLRTPFVQYDSTALTWRQETVEGKTICTVTVPTEGNQAMFFYAKKEKKGLTAFRATMPSWTEGTVIDKGTYQEVAPAYNSTWVFTNGTDVITIPCHREAVGG